MKTRYHATKKQSISHNIIDHPKSCLNYRYPRKTNTGTSTQFNLVNLDRTEDSLIEPKTSAEADKSSH
jgi:hypothetical protein